MYDIVIVVVSNSIHGRMRPPMRQQYLMYERDTGQAFKAKPSLLKYVIIVHAMFLTTFQIEITEKKSQINIFFSLLSFFVGGRE